MLDKLLREIIVITVGKLAEPIADLLNSPKKYVNEFVIAKKLDITINQTRNILYKISDYGLVSSERKKDKKKGWYTYFWKFDIYKCLDFLKNKLLEGKKQYEEELKKRQTQSYYFCDLCNVEKEESEALLMNFTCDECGELFEASDNSKLIKELERNLVKIDDKLELVDIEIEKENKKIDKKKQLQFKKEDKEKELKKEEAKLRRLEKKKEREKEKAKADKLAGKTVKSSKKKSLASSTLKNRRKKVVKKKIVKKKITKKKIVKKIVSSKKKFLVSSTSRNRRKKKVTKKKIVHRSAHPKLRNAGAKKVTKKKISKKKKVI